MSSLSNHDILRLAKGIPHFRGVFMKDALPNSGVLEQECGIVNLDSAGNPGTHWVSYYKDKKNRIYFDSFAQTTPVEIQKYLKTDHEFKTDIAVIQRNTDIVQHINTSICGHLCLFVLKALEKGESYQKIINKLREKYGYTQDRK